MSKRIALYLRVSTTEQTVENQQRELEAVAERHGWNVVAAFTDAGISGTKGRDKRPGYDCLCRGIARREFDQVAAWSVDRLGRSLQELVGFLGELQAKNVDLYLHQQGLDTGTPAGKALFQMLGVFADDAECAVMRSLTARAERLVAYAIDPTGLGAGQLPPCTLHNPSSSNYRERRAQTGMLGHPSCANGGFKPCRRSQRERCLRRGPCRWPGIMWSTAPLESPWFVDFDGVAPHNRALRIIGIMRSSA